LTCADKVADSQINLAQDPKTEKSFKTVCLEDTARVIVHGAVLISEGGRESVVEKLCGTVS